MDKLQTNFSVAAKLLKGKSKWPKFKIVRNLHTIYVYDDTETVRGYVKSNMDREQLSSITNLYTKYNNPVCIWCLANFQ